MVGYLSVNITKLGDQEEMKGEEKKRGFFHCITAQIRAKLIVRKK